MTRTWTYTVLLLLAAPALLFGQFDPLAEGGEARVVFERALASESREEWEVLLGLGLDAGGFGGNDALAIGQALLVQWLTERWAAEVGAPDRQALVDAIAAANTQYLFVYDSTTATYGQDSVGDYLLQDSTGYLEPGGEREAWLAQVETAGDAALAAWRAQTQATYLELLAAEGIEQSSGIGQAFAASIAQYQAAAEREFTALIVRQERQLSYLRLQDTLSARREGEAQSAATVTDELVGATQVGLAEVTQALAAAVPNADDPAEDLNIDPDQWQESFRRQFEAGLAAWGEAEDRFVAERLAWETDAQQAYATAEGEWDQAFIEFGTAREAWFTQMNQILAAGQNAWGQQLADFAADVQDELASLAAAQAEEQATRAAEAQAYLAAYEQASGVLAMAEQNIAYLKEREAGLLQWERDTVQAIEDMRAQIETVRADEYQAQSEIQVWQAREAELLVKIGREGAGGSDFYNPVTEHQSTELSGITFHFMNYGQALSQVRDELAAARSRHSQAIAEGAGEIANLRAAIEAAQAEVRDSDLQLVQDELEYWHGIDGTGGILAQFTEIRDRARGDIMGFVGRVSDGLVGTSSAEQEQHRLSQLVAMLQDEAAIAQAVADYAVDTSSQRATKAETADALAAANTVMATAQTVYSDAVVELQRLSSIDVADAQADVAARQTELADLHTQLSEAKQQLENATVAFRLRDAGVYTRLLQEIDDAIGPFVGTTDLGNRADYRQLAAAYFGPAWEAELIGEIAAGAAAEAELIDGDPEQLIPSLTELAELRDSLLAVNLAAVDPAATGPSEFETYLLTTTLLDPADPALLTLVDAYGELAAGTTTEQPVLRARLTALLDQAIIATDYQIQVRERAVELVAGRFAADGTVLPPTADAVILSPEAAAELEAAIELTDAAAQLAYRQAHIATQLAVNGALRIAATAEADWIAALNTAAVQSETAAVTAETAASDAAAAASTAENERLAAAAALADAVVGGDPDAIDAAQAVLDQAEADATAAADTAQAAGVAATTARAAADQAAAAVAAAQDSHWPDPDLIAALEAALDTTDPAQAMALEQYLIGARALDASAMGELTAAHDLLADTDRSNLVALGSTLGSDVLAAATVHRDQFATAGADLLNRLVRTERDAALAASAGRQALTSYGHHGYAWLEVRLRERVSATDIAIATFTAALPDPIEPTTAIDVEVFAAAYRDLIAADAPAFALEALGLYARSLFATGNLTPLDPGSIDVLDPTTDADRIEAYRWLVELADAPAPGVTLAQLAGRELPAGVQQPNAVSSTMYREIFDAAAAQIVLPDPPGVFGPDRLADYTTRAADMPAEYSALTEARSAFLGAEAAYREHLAQRVALEIERSAYAGANTDAFEANVVGHQDAVEALEAQVAAKEAELVTVLAAFTTTAEAYQAQADAVAAAEAAYDAARLATRTAEAIDDYARSGAVASAPDPQAAVDRAAADLSAAQTALDLITDLIESDRTQVVRDSEYQALLDRDQAQLQAVQELTLAADAVAAEIDELEGRRHATESNTLRFINGRGNLVGAADWLQLDMAQVHPDHLHGREAEFRDYAGYDPTSEQYTADLASWYAGVGERGGSEFLRRMAAALFFEVGVSHNYAVANHWNNTHFVTRRTEERNDRNYTVTTYHPPRPRDYQAYLAHTPVELRGYDRSAFTDADGALPDFLNYDSLMQNINVRTYLDRVPFDDVPVDAGFSIGRVRDRENGYSKATEQWIIYEHAAGEYHAVKNTAEYHYFRLMIATGNYPTELQTIVNQEVDRTVLDAMEDAGWDRYHGIAWWRGRKRNEVKSAIRNLPQTNSQNQRNQLLKGNITDDVAAWHQANQRLAELQTTAPTVASVQAEITAKGGTINSEVAAAVDWVFANGTASQTASVAAVLKAAVARIGDALAETEAQLGQRARQMTAAAAPAEQDYLATLGRYLAGQATEVELTGAMNARYVAPAFDAVDHLSARIDNTIAVDSRSAAGELAKLQTLVNRAMQTAAHADAGLRTRIAARYATDQEQLQRAVDRWSQQTTNLLTMAVDEWNRSATHLEGQRVRWRQETEEHYAEAAQLWDMRHAQLVTSRDAWLEDATRHAMVASSEAIAVQWDLEATALIADAESAIIPSFGVATPDLAALVEDATASSTLEALIARADTLQSRARDTNVVVAAYLPTVNTRAAEASTARAVTADLFDQVTERAAVLAAIQAREQFTAQQEGMESGIRDANDSVAYNLSDQMAGAGYRRSGATWRRRMPIGDTLFGGTEYETHKVAAYRNFISPGFRSSVDLSDAALVGLSGQAIFTLVNEATEEMNRYQVLVFGRSDEQKRQGDNRFVQAASAAEFTDSLSALLSDAQTAWRSGAGYRQHEHKDTEGLFNFHVGYAPVIDRDNPERIGQAGYGQLGRIMGAFMVNEARAQRGYAAITTPAYRKPLWDDDKDNDGNSDGLFGAPTIASVVDIGVTVALTASGMGAPLVAALSLVDDAVFAAADVSTGYMDAGSAFKQLGIKAATSAATMGIQHLGSMADAAITTGSKLLEVGTDLAIKAAEMTTTNATIAVLNNGFDGDAVWNATFGRDAMRQYTVGLVDTLVDSSLQTGIFGTTGGDLANARALSGLAGGLSGAAVEYGLTGSTKFNVLNLGDFTGGEHSLGLLELNIGGNQSMFNLGTGGVGISSSQLRQAYAGFEVFQASREIGQQGFVGEEAIAMRMLRSLGEDETSQLFDDLMTGKASIEDLATSGIRARTELNEQDGRDIHVNADELDGGPFALAITLAHEAFRDGVVGDETSQRAETTAAVLGHVDAARALMAGYGNLSVSREQRQEVEVVTMLQAIEQQTGATGLVEQYANSAYDSSADYWRLTADGRLEITEDGWLKDENDEYILNDDGERIGAEGIETGLLNILYGADSGYNGRSYESFSAEQRQATHQMLADSGFNSYLKGPEGDLGSYWWDLASNDGKSIGADMLAGYDLPGAKNSGLLNGRLPGLFASIGLGHVSGRIDEITNGLEQNPVSIWDRIAMPRQNEQPGLLGRAWSNITNRWNRLWGNEPESMEERYDLTEEGQLFDQQMLAAVESALGQNYVPKIIDDEVIIPVTENNPRNDCDIWGENVMCAGGADIPIEFGTGAGMTVRERIDIMQEAGLLQDTADFGWSFALLEDSRPTTADREQAAEHFLLVRRTDQGYQMYEMGGLSWQSTRWPSAEDPNSFLPTLEAMKNYLGRDHVQDIWHFYPLRGVF